jgi:hypothetical protein
MADEVARLEIFVGVLRFVPVSYRSMNIPYWYTFIHFGRSAVQVLRSSLSTPQTNTMKSDRWVEAFPKKKSPSSG